MTAALVSGLLREGYSFAAQPISDLGIGPNAWIMNASLISTGLLAVIFALGFRRLLPRLPRKGLATGLLVTFGLCFAAAGIFPEPSPDGPVTIAGIAHFVLGFFIAMSALTVALFLIASGLRKQRGWDRHASYPRVTGLVWDDRRCHTDQGGRPLITRPGRHPSSTELGTSSFGASHVRALRGSTEPGSTAQRCNESLLW
jgi:hypothetical protein